MRRHYAIHPGIGIARVGDSPDEYFLGPEAPGVGPSLSAPDAPSHAPPHNGGTYKDGQHRVKRQGARFRVYEYSFIGANRRPHRVREITAADADIEWEVHLANRKAAAPRFKRHPTEPDVLRNAGVPAPLREQRLIIDAGARKIGGARQSAQRLTGSFQGSAAHGVEVPLGDLLTDGAGRLIVLGGFGTSQFVVPGRRLKDDFANNDDWCDDISDGPVRATVRLRNSAEVVEAEPAWVIVAPPDFAPGIENVVTLYDVVFSLMAEFVDPSRAVGRGTKISFTREIFPILQRVSQMHWVSRTAEAMHGPGKPFHFLSKLPELSSSAPDAVQRLRERIFRQLRNPSGGGGNMPKLASGLKENEKDAIEAAVTLTKVQYARMRKWAAGKFVADWEGRAPTPKSLDELSPKERPHALDRAALETCAGAGFFPGIEVGRVMLEEGTYDKRRPFRINPALPPGELTSRMAVPWQADFWDCTSDGGVDWWPAQRPVDVFLAGSGQDEWTRGVGSMHAMVDGWRKLGFVVREAGTDRYVEAERSL